MIQFVQQLGLALDPLGFLGGVRSPADDLQLEAADRTLTAIGSNVDLLMASTTTP